MKQSILLLLVVAFALLIFACTENPSTAPEVTQNEFVENTMAKKPAPNLIGAMELDFTFGAWPEEPVWVGTLKFNGYSEFGIRFFHLSEFRDYSQASPFEEYFEIYDLGDEDLVYLAGPDFGVTTTANKPPEPCKYRMNGEIDVANEPFAEWMGRKVHMSGEITWQVLETPGGPVVAPEFAPGTLRIN